ncbi:hypothetical protein FA10DRAFT_162203 [Acaromyces ingoldii]|uniref:Uncharacterized protein n=1 Tax=Acaromyces ingoldii TaxID=215250 RepID=A0A316YH32_9BASI|nr:hypothetical protein FA10DRAFT_162203 [Acaromyces ingoldii]PWN88386.1 hypothetical protein FA10DRAFT_162203 [Acaromyces ingoldii]
MVMSELPPRPTAAAKAAEAAAASSAAPYPPPLMSSYNQRHSHHNHHQTSRRPPVRGSERNTTWSSSSVAPVPSSSSSSSSSSTSSSPYSHSQRYDDHFNQQLQRYDRYAHPPPSLQHSYHTSGSSTTHGYSNHNRSAHASSSGTNSTSVPVHHGGGSSSTSHSPATSTTSTGSSLRTPPDLLLNGSTLPTGIYPAKGYGSWNPPDRLAIAEKPRYLSQSQLQDRIALIATLSRDVVIDDSLPSPPASPRSKPRTSSVDSSKAAPSSSSSSSRKRSRSEVDSEKNGDSASLPSSKRQASAASASIATTASNTEKMSSFLKATERLVTAWLQRGEDEGQPVTMDNLHDVLDQVSNIGDAYFQGRAARGRSQGEHRP